MTRVIEQSKITTTRETIEFRVEGEVGSLLAKIKSLVQCEASWYDPHCRQCGLLSNACLPLLDRLNDLLNFDGTFNE